MTRSSSGFQVEDFDAHFSPELKKRVHATQECRRYLLERERVCALMAAHVERGGSLNDPELQADIRLITQLALELYSVIQACE